MLAQIIYSKYLVTIHPDPNIIDKLKSYFKKEFDHK